MGMISDVDGEKPLRAEISGDAKEAGELGKEMAQRLLREGADQILAFSDQPAQEKALHHGSRKE
jgi:porphobilinogen deaminase